MKHGYRYWDACCFLGWLKEENGKIEECHAVIEHAERDEVRIITSALTIAEVLWLTGEKPIPKEDRDKVRGFFENDYIVIYGVDRIVSELAQDVIWDHGVKPKDAIHVATALSPAPGIVIEQLDTFDGPLIQLSEKLGDPKLKIGRPNMQHTLFTSTSDD